MLKIHTDWLSNAEKILGSFKHPSKIVERVLQQMHEHKVGGFESPLENNWASEPLEFSPTFWLFDIPAFKGHFQFKITKWEFIPKFKHEKEFVYLCSICCCKNYFLCYRTSERTWKPTEKSCRIWTEQGHISSTLVANKTQFTSKISLSVLNSGGKSWCDGLMRRDGFYNKPTRRTRGYFVFLFLIFEVAIIVSCLGARVGCVLGCEWGQAWVYRFTAWTIITA